MLSGVYLDEEFRGRGPALGVTMFVSLVCLIAFLAFMYWAVRQP